MKRPLPELADIIAAAGRRFMDRPPAWFTWLHLKVLVAIERCRTAAMGGHLDQCSGCGHRAISYNSCRNRHCPKCQSQARNRWLAARRAELLATPYAHVVFTLPHQLAPLALQNKEVIYGLLFRCTAQTLIEIAADPKRLGAEIGFFSVLHTWNQKLQQNPHS
jgi:Transposase zinc-binding domain